MKSSLQVEMEHVFGPGIVRVASDIELGTASDPSVRERNQIVFADMAVALNLLIEEVVVQKSAREHKASVDGQVLHRPRIQAEH